MGDVYCWYELGQTKAASFFSLPVHAGFTGWMYLPYPQVCHLPLLLLELTLCFMQFQKKYVLFYIKLGQDFISPNLKVMH